jgi:TrmH family RNA methyltransferase
VSNPQSARLDRVRRARRDPDLAVIEGFHALKHALRFDAEVLEALCAEPQQLDRLAAELAPDLAGRLRALAHPVEAAIFEQLAPRAARTGVIAIAKRPHHDLEAVLQAPAAAPIVLLEQPRDLGNTGACVRVAAAAQAAGVIVTGRHDPWHPDAIRGAAGLHYALPVLWAQGVPAGGERPLVALDPEGQALDLRELPSRAMLAFGSERQGLSQALLDQAALRVRIPMRAGVSSLNLATSLAAVLFALRLLGGPQPGDQGSEM